MGDAASDLYARGLAAWPEVDLSKERFLAELARRLGDQRDDPSTIASLHHDVYLAIAAAAGDEAAAGACERACATEVELAASRLRATQTQADDIRGELRRLLFTEDEARPAAITTFTGRGDLRGYARVIVARALVRRMQRDRREVAVDDEVLEAFTPTLAPEIALLRERYRPEVDAAFRTALAELPARSRALLRYHLIDGWSIDQIGTQYGVHRATAARWLTAARDDLGARMRADLARRLEITESQVDSIVELVTSRIELSLDRLLAP
jgi:RNA polymerase sigma-70 factor, ECF subfamily